MKRFNGVEKYEIKSATWNIYRDEDKINMCLLVESDQAISQAEDTESIFQMLHWELNLVEKKLDEEQLQTGFKAKIPEAYDESRNGWITNFYFCEHEGSENNTIHIIETDKDKLLIRITGEITDVNYYDGSKDNSLLLVETWFTKNNSTMRSMQ